MSFISRESLWRNRDLRIVVTARAASFLGDEVAIVALVLRLHDQGASTALVAALIGAGMLPMLVLAPIVGVVVDRYDSRRLLFCTSLAQAAVCAALAFVEGQAAVLALAAVLGAGQALNQSTLAALVPRIVGDDRLAEAQGLLQASFTLVGVAAPALAGVLTGIYGTSVPLLLDAATFLCVTAAALLVATRRRGSGRTGEVRAREGVAFLRRDPVVAPLVLVLTAFVVFGMMVNVVEVFLVRDTLAASATWYGVLGATWAGGLVVGSMRAGRLGSEHARVVGACAAAAVMSLSFLGFAAAPHVTALVPVTIVGGIANGFLNVCAFGVLMARAPDEVRGRVSAAIAALISAASISSLVAGGALGQALEPRQLFALSGLLSFGAVAACVPRAIRASRAVAGGRPPGGLAEPARSA
jgi:MFS family permease